MSLDDLIALLVALAAIIYLAFALLFPERF